MAHVPDFVLQQERLEVAVLISLGIFLFMLIGVLAYLVFFNQEVRMALSLFLHEQCPRRGVVRRASVNTEVIELEEVNTSSAPNDEAA
jgi:hypothetical protein